MIGSLVMTSSTGAFGKEAGTQTAHREVPVRNDAHESVSAHHQ